ncbi:hypothetical protein [Hypericibacter sp.]|uniref:hypothetical protein n=1 Tax=Hypericibacter sp. TaxID=2705401 RepID=UPI003D6CD6E6
MSSKLDFSNLVSVDSIQGEDEQETREFKELHLEARRFIESFPWHGEIKNEYFGLGVAYIVAVFLFELVPAKPSVDSFLWVIVGAIPPAYLVIDDAPAPLDALRAYIGLMREWAEAVKAGESIQGIIPVNATATIENATDLESRLNHIEQHIIPQFA